MESHGGQSRHGRLVDDVAHHSPFAMLLLQRDDFCSRAAIFEQGRKPCYDSGLPFSIGSFGPDQL